MKKIKIIAVGLLILKNRTVTFTNEYNQSTYLLSYTSASSLKYKINSLNRQIKNNEYQIKKIKRSTSLSNSEKRSKINRLEYKNRQLKRKIVKIKQEYSKAIS